MTQVVQASCPNCRNLLRIPAEWMTQPMKCKHCQQIFQARPVGVATPTPLPPAAPAPLSYDPSSTAGWLPPTAPRPRKGGLWKAALLFGLGLVIGAGVLIFAAPRLSALFARKDKGTPDQKKAAQILKGKTDPGGETSVSPATDKKDNPPPKLEPKIEPKTESKAVDPPKKNDPPPKIDPSKKTDPPKQADPPKKKEPDAIKGNVLFPRRALLINVSNYLLFNPLSYGSKRADKYPGSSTAALADTMNRPPFYIPGTQITELADSSRSAFSTAKAVIENAISDFADTAREQDRIIVLFTGHALDKDKEAYLVPVEGNREDTQTLIPLTWIYDKLAKCRARQKLLILDVCRYPPARGEELPGTGEMTEEFEAKLQNPPAGVQVWASCSKGQQAIELEAGSVFLQALCTVLQERLPGIQEPTHPLPVDAMVPKVNQRLKEILAPQKLEQLSRLYGSHVEEGGAAFNAAEPLSPRLVLKVPAPAGGESAGLATVKNILDEINHLPPVRASQKQVQAASLPFFSAKALDDYRADYKSWSELTLMAKDNEKYPLRAAVLEAIQVLEESEKITMRESLTNPGGPITPQTKKEFADGQKEPGIMIFQMETALADLKAAGQLRDKETSKRWLANYDYALARLQSRLVYIYEYNYILAQVRSDSLPPLEPIHNGWRVGSQKKVQISEPKVKEMVKSISKTWKRIAQENPGTPWAILATRESMAALGLVWRPSRD